MPNDITITISHGDPTTGKLDFLPVGSDSLSVNQFDRIHWVIDPGSNVASIDDIGGKKGEPWLFIGGPRGEGNGRTGRVVNAPKVYKYYVTWTEKLTTGSHTYDPKIAVKPVIHLFLLVIILVFILGLTTVGIRRLFSAKK